MPPSGIGAKEYKVSIRTDNIREAISSAANVLYALVEEALIMHEDHEAEECDFELFARDVLAILTRHSDVLQETEEPQGEDAGPLRNW